MLCSVWAALLQLAVVLRLATKVRGRGTGGSGHREHRGQGRRPMGDHREQPVEQDGAP